MANESVKIVSNFLTAEIAPHGAELRSLVDSEGRQLMTDADPAYWTGHAPVLFPIVGRVNNDRYRQDGVEYEIPKHGFARRSHFEIVESHPASVLFRLTDSPATRPHYPFAFALEMRFMLHERTLSMTATVRNTGSVPMLASFGFHPAFAWPLPFGGTKEDHVVRFEHKEPGALKEISRDGLIAAEERATPVVGDTIALKDSLFSRDALVWDTLHSRALRYGVPGQPGLSIAFPDTDRLGLWMKPGARYLCIEPWAGIADPEHYDGEFRAKPGVFEVAPGDERSFRMTVTVG
ncbi:aldose 1-epimerase family protein [Sphingomonas sp.]|uniref:aldose 1-epimerase family protein n=1 Tax=Sphingomonas sp. TaxID=28214 RepID=UPI0025FC3826|nr:aldose 1-epimerase family protein [Sphingomonas sp.]